MSSLSIPIENMDSGQDRHPMDLVSKSNIKQCDVGKTLAQQQMSATHIRGITTAVGHTQTRILSSGANSLCEPSGVTSVVVMSVPRGGMVTTAPGSSVGTTLSQSSSIAARTSAPVAAATTTYHVPRGAAAVANIAAPRPGTTSLGRTTPGATTITHASKWVHRTEAGSLVTGLRGLVPRTASPGAAWLGSVSQAATVSAAPRPRPPMTSMPPYVQPRPPTLSVTTRPSTPQGSRLQVPSEPVRPQVLHTTMQKQTSSQNTAAPVSVPSQILSTQVSQRPPPAPTSMAVSTQAPMAPRVVMGPVVSASPIPPATGPAASRPVQAALLSSASRPAPGPAGVRPCGAPARSVAAPPTAATLALNVGTQVRPRLTATGSSRLTGTSSAPAPRLLSTPARPVTSPTATVLPTQARLGVPGPASVVSLHPVVVSTGTGLPLKTNNTRPALGTKVLSQPLLPPASIQITQMPVGAVQAAPKIPPSIPAIPQAQSSRAVPVPNPAATPLTVEHAGPVLSAYNIPTYVYEPSGGAGSGTYQVTGVVARPYTAPAGAGGPPTATYTVQTSTAAVLRPSGVMATSAPVKFNPVVVVDPTRSGLPVQSSYLHEGSLVQTASEAAPPPPPPPAVSKPSASPRPSILRKRDNEGSPLKIQKNLTPVLASLGPAPSSTTMANTLIGGPPVSPPSPRRPDSRGGGGGSSGGSTTISATSSPGLGEAAEDSNTLKESGEEPIERPPPEMSPRKKPRKQQLTGNELHEPKFSEDEMEFIRTDRMKEEVIKVVPLEEPIEKPPIVPPTRKPGLTLLGSYRHSWKSRHNHYVRYSDVRPKDERRPTVAELASQKQVLQKLDGWKVHHLVTQMEELTELEQQVSDRLSDVLKLMEKRSTKDLEKDVNRVNELIKGNMQRSKVTCDQMQEAKSQVMKIFDHKGNVAEIINRSANKRSLKKREKS